jgi:glycosyltransferase involved in cell wall biosynthesis
LCADKGIVEAIEIARRLNLPLKIAGKIDFTDRAYFEQHVQHLLDGKQIEYIGEVDQTAKIELFRQAIALVYPINFDEPFGLVMAEALASGVPPLALNRGAVREVLNDETAVIGESVDELVDRFGEIERISRRLCRLRAESRFSKESMVDNYESVFQRLTLRNRLQSVSS